MVVGAGGAFAADWMFLLLLFWVISGVGETFRMDGKLGVLVTVWLIGTESVLGIKFMWLCCGMETFIPSHKLEGIFCSKVAPPSAWNDGVCFVEMFWQCTLDSSCCALFTTWYWVVLSSPASSKLRMTSVTIVGTRLTRLSRSCEILVCVFDVETSGTEKLWDIGNCNFMSFFRLEFFL